MSKIIHNQFSLNNIYQANNLSLLYYNLFYLQKKIYIASKECHNSLVQSLQKLLVHSYLIKYLAFQIVNKYTKNILYTIQNKNIKSLIFNNFNYNKNQESNYYIVYWCLQSEWLAKKESNELSKIYLFNNYVYKQTYLINHYSSSIRTYYYFEQPIDTCAKNTDIKYLISKLQTIKWIKNKVCNSLLMQHLKEFSHDFNMSNILKKSWFSTVTKNLYVLCNQILLIGMQWLILQKNTNEIHKHVNFINMFNKFSTYIIFSNQCKTLCSIKLKLTNFLYNVGKLRSNNLKKDYFIVISERLVSSDNIKLKINKQDLIKILNINISIKIYQSILRYIKSFLYHKDKYNRYRFNSYLDYKRIIKILNKQFRFIDYTYKNLVSSNEYKYINFIIHNKIKKLRKNKIMFRVH